MYLLAYRLVAVKFTSVASELDDVENKWAISVSAPFLPGDVKLEG